MTESLFVTSPRRAPWHAPGVELKGCVEPRTIDKLCQVMAEASAEKTPLLVIGGATRLGWGSLADGVSLGVSTLGLTGVDTFEPDEGVLHARAGTPIAEVQEIASAAGWELPLDPPGKTSTVGGTIASAATGPRAQAFGRVADAILGLDVVGADGVATHCGGRVVKNVTGYDLAKLYCGSFGTLGVLTGAWLRLRPVPKRRIAMMAPLPRDPVGFDACRKLANLTSVRALVWVEGEISDANEGVYFELGGSVAEVDHDLATIDSGLSTSEIPTGRIDALRDARASSQGSPASLRMRVLGVDLEAMVRRLRGAGWMVAADLGLGVVHARGSVAEPDELLALREAARQVGGFVVFEELPAAWRSDIDCFGTPAENADLAAEIKRRFDPSNVLNPGRLQAGS
jgi:glycolate oxidase FAD binding subunit